MVGACVLPQWRFRNLSDLFLLRLTESQIRGPEEDLQLEELQEEVGAMARCKIPGPDGLPVEYYQMFVGLLLPRLPESLQESGQSMQEAQTVMLLKPGKDPGIPVHIDTYPRWE
ncbi:hypothetical protein NDU88_003258 [Pleurodeles waltl]|uniref:Uncharacterized protein n=1 Tax=Pleurodeles waltl TaxID=8319 RepID=A0AAV7PCE8_PLEWA|nr:hypothetical protein NDU88_003258 [Pleurodeles waltl]